MGIRSPTFDAVTFVSIEGGLTMRFITKRVLPALLAVSMVMPYQGVSVDAATKEAYVSSLTVKYVGGNKDIGDSLSQSDFSVTGKKGSSTVSISDFDISENEVNKESTRVKISYKNEKDKTISKTVTVKATLLVKKIKAVYRGSDVKGGYTFTSDDFKVTGTRVDKKTTEIEDFTIEPETMEKPSQTVKILYTNTAGKELKASCKVSAKADYKSIDADFTGADKDIGDSLTVDDFKVTGKTYGGKTETLSDFTLSADKVEGESNKVTVSLTNSFGKELKKTVSVPADKVVRKIEASCAKDYLPRIGSTLDKSNISVGGVTKGGSKVDISDFTVDAETLDKERNSVKVSYTNTAGKTLTKQVVINAHNYVESLKAEYKGDVLVSGETIPQSKVKVTAVYEDGTEKNVSSGNFKLGSTKVVYNGHGETESTYSVVVTYTGDDKAQGSTGAMIGCDIPVRSKIDGVNFLLNLKDGKSYWVGDTADMDDFTITPAAGSNYKAEDIDIKKSKFKSAKLNEVNNLVEYTIVTVYGDKIDGEIEITAQDWATDIKAEVTSEIEPNTLITRDTLANYVEITKKMKSGESVVVSNLNLQSISWQAKFESRSSKPVIPTSIGVSGDKIGGGLPLSSVKAENEVTLTYTEPHDNTKLTVKFNLSDVINAGEGADEITIIGSSTKTLTVESDLSMDKIFDVSDGVKVANVRSSSSAVSVSYNPNKPLEKSKITGVSANDSVTLTITTEKSATYKQGVKTVTIVVKKKSINISEKTPSKKSRTLSKNGGTASFGVEDIASISAKFGGADKLKITKVEVAKGDKYISVSHTSSSFKVKNTNDTKNSHTPTIKVTVALKDNSKYSASDLTVSIDFICKGK